MADRLDYNLPQYKKWRFSIFARDGFQCQLCGRKKDENTEIQAHHIKTYANHVNLRYNFANGITLCVPCHRIVTGREKEYEDLFRKKVKQKIQENKKIRNKRYQAKAKAKKQKESKIKKIENKIIKKAKRRLRNPRCAF